MRGDGHAMTPSTELSSALKDANSERSPRGEGHRLHRARTILPGVAAAVVVAVVATGLGHLVPVVGAPVFGIVMGMLLAPRLRAQTSLRPGLTFSGKLVLQAAVVAFGLVLSLRQIVHVGVHSLPVMLGTLCIALVGAYVYGRVLKTSGTLTTLIGVGTGICGASAIAATTAVIDAAEADTAYAISTIFAYNVIAVLLYPTIGLALGLSQHAFGLWAGTAINDTSSVVAAGTIYGSTASTYAIVVKLTRTLMIIPICLGLAFFRSAQARNHTPEAVAQRLPLRRMFPTFIGLFVLAALVDTAGLVPRGWHSGVSTTAGFLITIALSAIGMSSKLGDMRRTGFRPLLLGGLLWVTVGLSSLLLQGVTGQL